MVQCCDPNGLNSVFDTGRAAADARRYRRKGLTRETRAILGMLVDRGVEGATVLEIGEGIGDLLIELLRAGASRATGVEISPAYEDIGRELATERGVAERIDRRVADFGTGANGVAAADAVILNKVVCCYPDMPALVRPAAEHARRWLVLVFPADRWWIRSGVWLGRVGLALFRSPFRFFFHEPAGIAALAHDAGLRDGASRRGLFWQVQLWERA
jgi:magnesium-protoporphyrin O-methyltransferase